VVALGRKPIIRDTIINVLKASEESLGPDEIRRRVAELLNRKIERVAETNLYANLSLLVKRGQVEKQIINGKPFYKLSNSFYKSENKSMIKSIIDSADLKAFIPRFEKKHPPLTAYIKNLERVTNPKRVIKFFTTNTENQNWSNPIDLISRRMLVTFVDLPLLEKDGIKKLLAHAYWYGVQSVIKDFGKGSLTEILTKTKKNAIKELNSAKEREEPKWIEALNILIHILEITEEIPSRNNLNDLLTFFQKQSPEINKLQKQLLALTYENLNSGEKIYDCFLDFHGCTLIGLQAAGLVPKQGELNSSFPTYRYLLNYGEVWDQFIFSIFDRFNFDNEFQNINGNIEQTLFKIKKHEEHLWPLMELPFRSKMFIVYLWGYPEIFHVSDKAFLPMFAEWFSALKAGYLDQRSWIFNEKSIIALINALKAVRRDKAPPDGIIDLVRWTIKDLYQYHPRGKDVDFWEELLRELKRQMQQKPSNQELCRHISAALEGRY